MARALVCALVVVIALLAGGCDGQTAKSSSGKSSCSTLDVRKKVVRAAHRAGFAERRLAKVLQVACAESRLKAHARLVNVKYVWKNGKKVKVKSTDRGWMQFNDKAHPEISTWCADNLACAMQQAYRVSSGGTSWGQWCTTGWSSCGGKGKDLISQYAAEAKATVSIVKREGW